MNYENFLDETKELFARGEEFINNEQYDDAIKCFEETVKVQSEKYGVEHESTVACMTQLGMSLLVSGNFAKAKEVVSNAITIALKVYKRECKEIGNLYYLLGTADMQLGDNKAAAVAFHHVVLISTKVFGENASETIAAAQVYNRVMAKIGGSEEERQSVDSMTDADECYARGAKCFDDNDTYLAPRYFKKAIELKSAAGDPDDQLIEYYRALAISYTELEMNDDALEALTALLDIAIKLHGDSDVNVSGTYNLMGYNYMVKGDYANAITHLNKCISIDIKLYGEKSLEVVRDYNILASMYRMSGEIDKSIATYVIVENLAAMTEDESARDILVNTYTDIAALYMQIKKYDEAKEYLHKKLHLCMHLYGEVSREVMETYNQMLSVAGHMNDDEEIAELLKKIDDIQAAASANQHHDGCTCGCHDHDHHHDECDDDDCDCHHHH